MPSAWLGRRPLSRFQRCPSRCASDASLAAADARVSFLEGVKRAVSGNLEFVPPHAPGATSGALYIRPLLFGSGPELILGNPDEFTFLVYVTPVGSLYGVQSNAPGVDALVLDNFDRAAPKGTGAFKLAGNYGSVASLSTLSLTLQARLPPYGRGQVARLRHHPASRCSDADQHR